MNTAYGPIDGVNTTNVLFIRSLIMCSEPTCTNVVATLVMLSTLSRNVHAVASSAHVSIEATRPMTPPKTLHVQDTHDSTGTLTGPSAGENILLKVGNGRTYYPTTTSVYSDKSSPQTPLSPLCLWLWICSHGAYM